MGQSGSGRVLLTDHTWPDVDVERSMLEAAGLEMVEAPAADEATLARLAADADAIMTCFALVGPGVIQAAPRLKVVARFGVGVDNIALDAATARRIPVTYVPDYCVAEVAEHALALLLASARGVARYDRALRQGRWDLTAGVPLYRLEGRTLGLLGYGRIGSRLARAAGGLGLRIVACDPLLDPDRARAEGVEVVSFDALLERADFLSLHLPLGPETRGVIGEAALRRMKRGAVLVNTARGGLVDTVALARALREGWIAGAALDVLPSEPPAPDDPLLRLDNVILTPHAAFYSEESLQALRRRATQSVIDVLSGRPAEHVYNRVALASPA